MWTLRKFYAGNGGCLPPTDPRILCMTPEQVDLDFMQIAIDRNATDNKESYTDDSYESYDEETEDIDRKLSDMPSFSSEEDVYNAMVKYQENQKENDWEDVETDS